MRHFLAAFALLAVVFTTSQVAGMERTSPKRHVQPAAAVQVKPSERARPSRKVNSTRDVSATADFRADELIPDICKGCSS
ncbi:MAG TPA: hypothetical protein VHB49_10180 [Bradyrhizobium sp.]|nr:hypothetical protein [Bradyrhizobium sp.]